MGFFFLRSNAMFKLKQKAVAAVAFVNLALLSGYASAASVLDANMKNALTDGFGDLMDTVKDVVATSWPYVLGATVVLVAPSLVQRMIHKAAGK